MLQNRHLKHQSKEQIKKIFMRTVDILYKSFGNKAFRREKMFVPTFYEAVMIGVERRLERGEIQNINDLKERYNNLVNNKDFLAVSVKIRDLTNEHNVKERLRLGTEAFAGLE